jgi:hypothetical protein
MTPGRSLCIKARGWQRPGRCVKATPPLGERISGGLMEGQL